MTKVANLYMQCAYTEKATTWAMSDCCRKPANTAVESPSGFLYWRCPEHEGLWKPGIFGRIHHDVPWEQP